MDNSAKGIICGKIINTCNEIKALLSTNGAFDIQLKYLKYLAEKLEDERMDSTMQEKWEALGIRWIMMNGQPVGIDIEGQIQLGPEELKGKKISELTGSVDEPRVGGAEPTVITKSVRNLPITHYRRNFGKIEVAMKITIKGRDPKDKVTLIPQTIEKIDDFAGYRNKTNNPLDKAVEIAAEYGGSPDKWTHSKAKAWAMKNGKKVQIELHWFENDEVGQCGWKEK